MDFGFVSECSKKVCHDHTQCSWFPNFLGKTVGRMDVIHAKLRYSLNCLEERVSFY